MENQQTSGIIPKGLPKPPRELTDQWFYYKFKAIPCRYVQESDDDCPWGPLCIYAHDDYELRPIGYGPTPEEAKERQIDMSPELLSWWEKARAKLAALQQRGAHGVANGKNRHTAADDTAVNTAHKHDDDHAKPVIESEIKKQAEDDVPEYDTRNIVSQQAVDATQYLQDMIAKHAKDGKLEPYLLALAKERAETVNQVVREAADQILAVSIQEQDMQSNVREASTSSAQTELQEITTMRESLQYTFIQSASDVKLMNTTLKKLVKLCSKQPTSSNGAILQISDGSHLSHSASPSPFDGNSFYSFYNASSSPADYPSFFSSGHAASFFSGGHAASKTGSAAGLSAGLPEDNDQASTSMQHQSAGTADTGNESDQNAFAQTFHQQCKLDDNPNVSQGSEDTSPTENSLANATGGGCTNLALTETVSTSDKTLQAGEVAQKMSARKSEKKAGKQAAKAEKTKSSADTASIRKEQQQAEQLRIKQEKEEADKLQRKQEKEAAVAAETARQLVEAAERKEQEEAAAAEEKRKKEVEKTAEKKRAASAAKEAEKMKKEEEAAEKAAQASRQKAADLKKRCAAWVKDFKAQHTAWQRLYAPLLSKPGSSDAFARCQETFVSEPDFKPVKAAIEYLNLRMNTPSSELPPEELRTQLALKHPYLMDQLSGWRQAPRSVAEYMQALIWELAMQQKLPVLDTVLQYMVENDEAAQELGLWYPSNTSWSDINSKEDGSSLITNLITKNKTKMLQELLDREQMLFLFIHEIEKWKPVQYSERPGTGVLRWARELGASQEVLSALLSKAVEDGAFGTSPTEVATMALHIIKEGYPPALLSQFVTLNPPSVILPGTHWDVPTLEALYEEQQRGRTAPAARKLLSNGQKPPEKEEIKSTLLHMVLQYAHPNTCLQLTKDVLAIYKRGMSSLPGIQPLARTLACITQTVRGKAPLSTVITREPPVPNLIDVVQTLRRTGAISLPPPPACGDYSCTFCGAMEFSEMLQDAPLLRAIEHIGAGKLDARRGTQVLKALISAADVESPERIDGAKPEQFSYLNTLALAGMQRHHATEMVNVIMSITRPNPAEAIYPRWMRNGPGWVTPLSLAVVSQNHEAAKAMLSRWQVTKHLLGTFHPALPDDHLDALLDFVLENKEALDVVVRPLKSLSRSKHDAVLDKAIKPGRQHLRALLLSPHCEFSFQGQCIWEAMRSTGLSTSVIAQMVKRGAHASATTVPDPPEPCLDAGLLNVGPVKTTASKQNGAADKDKTPSPTGHGKGCKSPSNTGGEQDDKGTPSRDANGCLKKGGTPVKQKPTEKKLTHLNDTLPHSPHKPSMFKAASTPKAQDSNGSLKKASASTTNPKKGVADSKLPFKPASMPHPFSMLSGLAVKVDMTTGEVELKEIHAQHGPMYPLINNKHGTVRKWRHEPGAAYGIKGIRKRAKTRKDSDDEDSDDSDSEEEEDEDKKVSKVQKRPALPSFQTLVQTLIQRCNPMPVPSAFQLHNWLNCWLVPEALTKVLEFSTNFQQPCSAARGFRQLLEVVLTSKDEHGKPNLATHLQGKKLQACHLFGHGTGADSGVADILSQLHAAGCIDPNERDPTRYGMPLLHLAAADLAEDAIAVLLQAGADPAATILPRSSPASSPATTSDKVHTMSNGNAGTSAAGKQVSQPIQLKPLLATREPNAQAHDRLVGSTALHAAVRAQVDIMNESLADASIKETAPPIQWHTCNCCGRRMKLGRLPSVAATTHILPASHDWLAGRPVPGLGAFRQLMGACPSLITTRSTPHRGVMSVIPAGLYPDIPAATVLKSAYEALAAEVTSKGQA